MEGKEDRHGCSWLHAWLQLAGSPHKQHSCMTGKCILLAHKVHNPSSRFLSGFNFEPRIGKLSDHFLWDVA